MAGGRGLTGAATSVRRARKGSRVRNAAESSAASPRVPPGLTDLSRPGPVRTCVGCRQRAVAADLLRVVVQAADVPGRTGRLRLDLRRDAPGRGAWLHPDPRCAEQAERRRAFARALRVPDVAGVPEIVALVVSGSVPTGPSHRVSPPVPPEPPVSSVHQHEGEKPAMSPR